MKKMILLLAVLLGTISVVAQNPPRQHRIVMQLTSNDTLVHLGLMKQLGNLKRAAPDAVVEVVCHGPGIEMLLLDRSVVQQKVDALSGQAVAFIACENTMRERKIDRAAILPSVKYVPAGILHIVERQEAGWSYIKAGF